MQIDITRLCGSLVVEGDLGNDGQKLVAMLSASGHDRIGYVQLERFDIYRLNEALVQGLYKARDTGQLVRIVPVDPTKYKEGDCGCSDDLE